MIIGTAGHIDHGKSALVRAITGTDPDRLKEEKARGITIDLGFATWPQPDGRVIGFVDVPGHERFVHTMLAGAHGIDALLLVIAADDGVMPQTREHLAIVALLGLTEAVVALTKTDLVDAARIAEVAADIRTLLAETPFRDAPVVPVSSITGAGMSDLMALLALLPARTRADNRRFRLAVDRSFSIAGAGTVVTGTILSGSVRAGDHVLISPTGLEARVRGLHVHNRSAEAATAGDRCALNLAGPAIAKDAINRGDVVLDPALHAPTRRLDARITVLAEATKGIGVWMPVRVHLGAAEIMGRAVPLEKSGARLGAGATGFVQIVLEAPLAATAGDRLVLRDISASRTIGGGLVVDVHAPERRRRTPERLAALAACDVPGGPDLLRARAACSPWAIDLPGFARDHALADAAPMIAAAGLVAIGPTLGLAAAIRDDLKQQIGARLDAHHAANPDQQGLPTDTLRRALTPMLAMPAFRALLLALQQDGEVTLQGAWLRRPGHAARLAPADEALWQKIAPELAGAARFRPPRVRDFATAFGADERRVRTILKAVARRGEVDEVALDHFFLRGTVAEMAGFVAELGAGREVSAAEFRDKLGEGEHNAGRKVAIQVLEFFDRHGITIRRGDTRRIDARRVRMFAPIGADGDGREASPVGRPDFKSGGGRQPVPGGFDSHSLPPSSWKPG